MFCALARITKTPVPKVVEAQAEEKLERVLTDKMRPFRKNHCQCCQFGLFLQTSTQNFCMWTCFRQKLKHTSLKNFVLNVRMPKKPRQDKAKEFLAEQVKMYCIDAGILLEKPYKRRDNKMV